MEKKPRKSPRPRDPFWRLRRLFGAKRKESAKAYRRRDRRKAEREAEREGE
jgi:hypothetical protein